MEFQGEKGKGIEDTLEVPNLGIREDDVALR